MKVAVWILGGAIAIQIGAIGWALLSKTSQSTAIQPESTASAAAPIPPFSGGPTSTVAREPAPPAATPAANSPALLDTPLTDNALYFLECALASRERGDMRSALTQLRAACDLQPDHPRLLYELALGYEKIALPSKAAEIWDRILKIGPAAGSFYKMAEMKFESGSRREPREIDVPLQFGKVLVRQSPGADPHRPLALRIPVQARDGAVINPAKVHLDVHFYDELAGGKVEPTAARISPARWLSGTPQWLSTPVEFVELTYQLPAMPQVGDELPSDRKFYGYVLKLYYNDHLQDVVVEPQQLAGRAHEPGERALENAVEKPLPDHSLFPLPVK